MRAIFALCCVLGSVLQPDASAQQLILSEFLAANQGGLQDKDGDPSDWIEIHNSGSSTVSLAGWSLTDNPFDLRKWTFPNTNLAGGGYLVVFASGKDRRFPGAELHTNFELDEAGEHLALVRPDGQTVEHSYAPFPPQRLNISHGLFLQTTTNVLASDRSAARWLVPTSSAGRPSGWADISYSDSHWGAGAAALGFDTGVVVGSGGTQTNVARGRTASQSSTLSSFSAGLAVDGNLGNFTHTSSSGRLPASWEVNLGTNLPIQEVVLHNRGDGCCGSRLRDITVLIISHDNRTTNFTSALLNPENVIGGGGLSGPPTLSLNLATLTGKPVVGGRVKVVRTPDPDLSGSGGQGNADEGNVLSLGEVQVFVSALPGSYKQVIQTDVQTAMLGANGSLLARIPFNVALEELPVLDQFVLRMKRDDGFVAYLNGVKVADANAPASPEWNSTATAAHPDAEALTYEVFDLTAHLGILTNGVNVLALQGLNVSAADDDFLLIPELFVRSRPALVDQYFVSPTPGAPNTPGSLGVVADTKFSVDRGFYSEPFQVEITSATPGAQIRYTTNGTAPSAVFGLIYAGPISINRTTPLRAIAVKPGFTPSDVDTHTYVFLDQVLKQSTKTATDTGYPTMWAGVTGDYAMDPRITTNAANAPLMQRSLRSLPSVFFSTSISNLFDSSKGIYSFTESSGVAWERPTSMELVDTNGATEFQENCGLRIQGGYFRIPTVTRKHSLRVLFKAQYGAGKLRHDLFKTAGAAREFDTFVLRAGANDGYAWADARDTEQFTRNYFGHDLQGAMGHPAPHGRFVHVYLNGIYWGLYEIVERPNEDFSSTYFGGEPADWDANNAGDVKNGDLSAWNSYTSQASSARSTADYLKLKGLNPDGARNPVFPVYLDAPNYIDYMIVNIWGGNWDWPNKNFWFGRNRTSASTGFKFYAWDFENTMGNNRDRSPINMVTPRSGLEDSWVGAPHNSLRRLLDYRMEFADHVQKHFFNNGLLMPVNLIRRYRALADSVELAILAETARWGDDNINPPQDIDDWRRERDWMTGQYLAQRSAVVLGQFRGAGLYPALGAPVLSNYGGVAAPGQQVTLSHTNQAGEIYFTLNGTDPRLPGGALAPAAKLYTAPIIIQGNLTLRTRVKNLTNWSAVVEAPFSTASYFAGLYISEIMYHPADEPTIGGDEFEFLELANSASTELDLSGVTVHEGIDFACPDGAKIPAGGHWTLVRNRGAFASRYPGVRIDGVYTGSLGNGGETVSLSHVLLGRLLSVTYGDAAPWPVLADGNGFSLVPRVPGNEDDPDDGLHWRASSMSGGSPGAADPASSIPNVVINEVLSNPHPDHGESGEYIELHNLGATTASIGGWFLTDDPATPKKYRIPAGTEIPAGGFFVVREGQWQGQGALIPFDLSAGGDEVMLFSADAGGTLTGYTHGFRFAGADDGVSFGRVVLSTGEEAFPAQAFQTPGAANLAHRVGNLVISEIHYNPASGDDEFVEILNRSEAVQALNLPGIPPVPWTIEGIGFSFPSGATLKPGERAVVCKLDPEVFRALHALPSSVQVFGPYPGNLQDSGERLTLQLGNQPGAYTDDDVRYNDRGGWPSAADGGGASLHRIQETGLGSDPINWIAAQPSPGAGWSAGAVPVITSQPRSLVGVENQEASFETLVAGAMPRHYQWQFRGTPIAGANESVLRLTNLQLSQAGDYRVVVSSPGGSTVSSNASLVVLVPPTITTQPTNVFVLVGSNANLTIAAVSGNALGFQWRFNGDPIQGANSATLALRGLRFQDAGAYDCTVTDGALAVRSAVAILTVMERAVLVQGPTPVSVPAGATAVFSASAQGSSPFIYRWRRNGAAVVNITNTSSVSILVISNVQAGNTGNYSVVVANAASASPASPNAALTLATDTDGDGIPNDWEVANGLNPDSGNDALRDTDGDTVNNRDEYISGTNPSDALSYLKVASARTGQEGVILEFHAVPNRTYSVLYRSVLGQGSWLLLKNVPAGTGARTERITDPEGSGDSRYYRLLTPAMP